MLPHSSSRGSHKLCDKIPVYVRVQIVKILEVEFDSPMSKIC